MVAKLKEEFADLDLTYSIGGQISFDVFPKVRVYPCLVSVINRSHPAELSGNTLRSTMFAQSQAYGAADAGWWGFPFSWTLDVG